MKDTIEEKTSLIDGRTFAYSNRVASLIRRFSKVAKVIKSNRKFVPAAGDVGESLSPFIPHWVVKMLYGVSIGYVLFDTSLKTFEIKEKGKEAMILTFCDNIVWHSLASYFLPGFTIHHLVEYSTHIIHKTRLSDKIKRFTPLALGFISIPMLIHPLDKVTDYVMNKTIRRLYKDKIKLEHHK